MKQWPRISVVTPSFNQGEFIRETLESIHGAGYPNLEHIVMDGGSTDGSVEIIRDFDDVISFWRSAPDDGQTAALIEGFGMATGEILCWLNSDDLFEPHTLFDVARVFIEHPDKQFVYGDALWIDEHGQILKHQREHSFSRFIWIWGHNYLPQPSTFWTRDLYHTVGGLRPEFDLAMDADLWARFLEVTSPLHVARVWSRMRLYAEQKNTRMRDVSEEEVQRVRARFQGSAGPIGRRAYPYMARLARVALKTGTGRYRFGEMVTHLRTLVGFGTWEERATASKSGTDR